MAVPLPPRFASALAAAVVLAVCFLTTILATPSGSLVPVGTGHVVNGGCSNYLPSGTVVAVAAPPGGSGYWMANSGGEVVTCGGAVNLPSLPFTPNLPIVGMAATPDGRGAWLVASDGGIFALGDASYFGSTGAIHLNKPIVGMAPTADGRGYWLVAADGGILAFGDARFHGSTGAIHLNQPVVGMALDAATGGYWLVATDGGIFSFNAPFYGSAVAPPPPPPEPPSGGSQPGSSASCSVSMSNPNPPQYSEETANIQSNVPNSAVTVTKAYKTVTSYDSGTTNGSGNAAIPFDISGATPNFTVNVTVNVGAASCSTSFTPT